MGDKDSTAVLPIGTYLTIEDEKTKHILRVESSYQHEPYNPSTMIIESGLNALTPDQKCQNLVSAVRIMEYPDRGDGMSSFIKPLTKARRSNQNEIDMAFENKEGMSIFPATAFARSCQNLQDNTGKFIQVKIPEDVFFHQMLIAGRTGSGKTVAMKYMSQYFMENFEEENGGGAVLAINVKEEDMLTMDKESKTDNKTTIKEWSDLGLKSHGVDTFRIYYPGNLVAKYSNAVDLKKCEKITLMTEHIDPETLAGLLENISDMGAEQLPLIFRFWKEKKMNPGDKLVEFIRYFADPNKNRKYDGMNIQGDTLEEIPVHPSTYQSILRALNNSAGYFDINGAKELNAGDILQRGKYSVVDVTAKGGFGFGSVLLRDLLDKIYEENSQREYKDRIPILIIIDEVHEFYGSAKSQATLQTLDAICRKGRSLKIGVIFSSQNPGDMPPGISSVVNTKIYFKTDPKHIRSLIKISGFDPEALKPGYAVTRVHGLSQLRLTKFPMSLSGVNDEKRRK